MVWLAPAAGYIDRRHVLRCKDCAKDWQREIPVWGDQHFTEDERCEDCGEVLRHTPSSEYVQAPGK